MAGGRPTSYRPEFCEMAIDYIGKQGKSVTQFATLIEVHKSSVYQWAKDIPEFSDALKLAQQYSESFWEGKYTNYIDDKNCNPALLNFYMSRRFWKENKGEEKPEPVKVIINVKS